jgi:hypothetical protein
MTLPFHLRRIPRRGSLRKVAELQGTSARYMRSPNVLGVNSYTDHTDSATMHTAGDLLSGKNKKVLHLPSKVSMR